MDRAARAPDPLRIRREARCLELLELGSRSKGEIMREFSAAYDPISESTIHSCMEALAARGLVRIDKKKLPGSFSSCRFIYTRIEGAA